MALVALCAVGSATLAHAAVNVTQTVTGAVDTANANPHGYWTKLPAIINVNFSTTTGGSGYFSTYSDYEFWRLIDGT